MGHEARVYGYRFPTAKAGGLLTRTHRLHPTRRSQVSHVVNTYTDTFNRGKGHPGQCSGLDLGGIPRRRTGLL